MSLDLDLQKARANPICDVCEGTGIVATTTLDPDSHEYVPDGDEPCICTLPDEDDYIEEQ